HLIFVGWNHRSAQAPAIPAPCDEPSRRRSRSPQAASCNPDRLPRLPSASGAQAAYQGHSKRLLHLSPILGLAALAREFSPAPFRLRPVHLSLRRKVLLRCPRAREIHRPSARCKRASHPDAGIFLQEIRSTTG